MNKKGLVGAIITIGILLVAGLFWFVGEYNSEENVNESEECFGEGCVKVQITCCSCNMGGEEKCVKESEVEKYKEKLNDCPKDLICAAVYNCEIESCNTK